MQSREVLIEMHDVMRHFKEHMWYDHGENDMPPQFTVRWRDMDPQAINIGKILARITQIAEALPAPDEMKREMTRPPRVLWGVLEMMKSGDYPDEITPPPTLDHPIEMIALAIEGYAHTEKDVDPEDVSTRVNAFLATHQPGDIEKRYQEDPGSGICEMLVTYVVETSALGTAEWSRISSLVHKGDAGRLEWEDYVIRTSEDGLEDGEHDILVKVMSRFVQRESLA